MKYCVGDWQAVMVNWVQPTTPTLTIVPAVHLQLLRLNHKSRELNLVSVGRQILIEKFISNEM